MSNLPNIKSEDTEELVAYLDGELDAESARRVEDRLTHDLQYREMLQHLERSWEFLDDLPTTDVDDDFTQSTLEMVAVHASEELEIETTGLQRKRKWKSFALVAGSAFAGAVGYFLLSQWLDRDNVELLQDVPIIERVDMYRHVDDFEFLTKLDDAALFGEETGRDEN